MLLLRVALYGGGAGVAETDAVWMAVVDGGIGGSDAFDVRKNGLAYVARYRKSTFKPFWSNGCWPFDLHFRKTNQTKHMDKKEEKKCKEMDERKNREKIH